MTVVAIILFVGPGPISKFGNEEEALIAKHNNFQQVEAQNRLKFLTRFFYI